VYRLQDTGQEDTAGTLGSGVVGTHCDTKCDTKVPAGATWEEQEQEPAEPSIAVTSHGASSERSPGSPGSEEPGASSPPTTRVAGMSDWSSSRAAPTQGGARLVVRASTPPEPIESAEAVGFGAMSVAAVSVEAPRLRKHDEAEAFSVGGDGGGGGVGGAEEHSAASASEDAHGGRRSDRSGGVNRPESGAESAGTHATNIGVGIGLVERLLPCAPVLSVMPVLPVWGLGSRV
jgi:hypothetical protein